MEGDPTIVHRLCTDLLQRPNHIGGSPAFFFRVGRAHPIEVSRRRSSVGCLHLHWRREFNHREGRVCLGIIGLSHHPASQGPNDEPEEVAERCD